MSASEDSTTAIRPAEETAEIPPDRRADTTDRFTPGTLLASRYRIVSPLGKGGMGEVYRADDIRLGQPVALKFLPAALAADSIRLQRLVDEVRIGRQISHPNVCRLYDIGETEGHHFLVMEYVDGEDLASLLRRIGRMPGDKALEIARGLCAGLAAAHEKGIIHRDLKPANVMIDGRGQARIADFGLAALAHDGSVADMSGTPQYMAPEQLTGGGASLRSDVYALGLVLHEMLTGKRVFEAKSLNELRALHADTKPLSLSSSGTDIDPGLDRVIQRCLAKDPTQRPASAREVLLSLPGGDPLQAAILAGETPSPEMVAAAGKVGDLPIAAAWAGLIVGLLSLLAVVVVSRHVSTYSHVPLDKSPEILTERARTLLAQLSPGLVVEDHATGFMYDGALEDYVVMRNPTLDRRERLGRTRPTAYRFFYRTSPQPLVLNGWIPTLPWLGPPELGRVLHDAPALTVPGMADVILDSEGRLTRFARVPPRYDPSSGPFPDPDFTLLLQAAGLDEGTLAPTPPNWTAPVESDHKAAWQGSYRDQPEVVLRVEAASWHGLPVSFEVIGPWTAPPTEGRDTPNPLFAATTITILVSLPLLGGGVMLVRRNLRLGRGDRRGAVRLAVIAFGLLTLAQTVRADHTSRGMEEWALVVHILSQGCYAAIVLWAIYLALEPAVRRRWPTTLISWSRLLRGDVGDPLVARDTLLGILFGLGLTLVSVLSADAPLWFGRPPSFAGVGVLTTLASMRHIVYYLLIGPLLGLLYSLSMLFMIYLGHAVFRSERVAVALVFAVTFPVLVGRAEDPLIASMVAGVFGAALLFALMKHGLWCAAVMLTVFVVFARVPFTLDPSSWYAGRSFFVVGIVATAIAVSAYLSLGGKPIFGRAFAEE